MPPGKPNAIRADSENRPALKVRLDELRAMIPELPPWVGEVETDELCVGLLDLLERKQRHLIQDNVRLVALRELTEALLRNPEEERVLRTLSLYLRQAHGLEEVMVLARGDRGELRGYRARAGISSICEAVRWSAETVKGTAWERALNGDTIRDASREDQPPGTPPPLPVILPLRPAAEEGPDDPPSRVTGLLAILPNDETGAGEDPLELEQLAFQVTTVLESVHNQQRTIRDRHFRECLMETMDDGLLAADAHGKVTTANRAAQALLELEGDGIVGRPLTSLRERSPELVQICTTCLNAREPVRHHEVEIRGSEDRYPISVSVMPLIDNLDEAGGIVVNLSDLRPIREMEEELRRLDRLAALGRFATAVAHEIRNPLAAIGAGVDFLSASLGPEKNTDLRLLRSEIARLDRIVADLLEPARSQPLQLRNVQIAKLVQRACHAVEPLARERDIRFGVRPPTEEQLRPTIARVDADRLLQVIVNLIRNAVEASQSGQMVEVGWDRDRTRTGTAMTLWVRDHGKGIEPADLEHIFEPFFSKKAGGTGLGLYVSHSVVEQHGGRLDVESNPGTGTRVSIVLPSPNR